MGLLITKSISIKGQGCKFREAAQGSGVLGAGQGLQVTLAGGMRDLGAAVQAGHAFAPGRQASPPGSLPLCAAGP